MRKQPPPPELIAKRAALVGLENATNALAGSALGVLLLRGTISEAQHEAGLHLARRWRRWRQLIEAPPPVRAMDHAGKEVRASDATKAAGGPVDDPDDYERARKAVTRMQAAIRRTKRPDLSLSLLSAVVLSDELPEALLQRRPVEVEALRDALDSVAVAVGIARPKAA